jgi:hypothetical protein
LFGHFGIIIGPRRPIQSRPVDSFGNNRMKAEKQEDCPAISPKSYVGILLIWTNGCCWYGWVGRANSFGVMARRSFPPVCPSMVTLRVPAGRHDVFQVPAISFEFPPYSQPDSRHIF